ncbi:MAG: ester cyclase [Candidatus Limnocylindrales bacterium]
MEGADVSEANKALVRRYLLEILNYRDTDALDSAVDADYVDHVAFAGQVPGIAGVRHRVATLLGSLDPQWTVHDLVAERDLVMVRWTLAGTHRGPFLGVNATGRPVSFNGIDIYRVSNGKLVEHWNVVDLLEFYRQVGMTSEAT